MENQESYFQYSSFTYELKEGTKAQYYYKEGEKNILPERISIGPQFAFSNSSKHHPQRVGELKATYKIAEVGKYKGLNPSNSIHTGIFPCPINYFYGYGILDERHKIYDLLIILETKPPLKQIRIFLLKDKGRPQAIIEALKAMESKLKKEGPARDPQKYEL